MKIKVDYLLVGTGAAPLLAAQRLMNRGDSVAILNPDPDFFLENSELPLDLLNFETNDADLNKRFMNNIPEQVYKSLVPEFPGALETWREEDGKSVGAVYQVESAPWIRARHRLWVAPAQSKRVDYLENLYLRVLDLGWKPKWMEGVSLAKRFPGFSLKNMETRGLEGWVGFLGPRFGDIDVVRYRAGLLEFVRERLGRENIHMSAHILDVDSKGVRFQGASGLPNTINVGKSILYFWTPKLQRLLEQSLEKYQPRALPDLASAAVPQVWEEWDILSRDRVNPGVVAHLEGVRVWSHGEGGPPPGGWNQVKVMRREPSSTWLSEDSFHDLSRLIFQFLGWEHFTVRSMVPRKFYRWNTSSALEYDAEGVRSLIIHSCDGPLHWIAEQVRQAIDGV